MATHRRFFLVRSRRACTNRALDWTNLGRLSYREKARHLCKFRDAKHVSCVDLLTTGNPGMDSYMRPLHVSYVL